jgi:CheY-like chemotaxis protein
MLHRIIGEDVTLKTECEPGPLTVLADRAQLEHAIMNLVVNARDAMPHGGTLSVTAGRAAAPPEGTGEATGDFCVLRVSDTGIGMSEAVRSRLFEPFFTTKEPGKGTGLGLSTVYGIVKQSGGVIECQSEEGRGTTFSIYLPATSRPAEGTGASPVGPPPRGSETVLVVEDEELVRSLVARILTGAGYTVIPASTGREGVDIAKASPSPPRLAITDVRLPGGMSGFDVALKLREAIPGIRLLLMSGYYESLAEGEDALVARGAFIAKPFEAATLLATVRRILDGDESV